MAPPNQNQNQKQKTPSLAVKNRVGGASTSEVKRDTKSAAARKKKSDDASDSDGVCLSSEQVGDLCAAENTDDAFNKMAVLLNLTNWREDMQHAIVLTYLFGIFQFAKENSFTPLQTSTFLSIMKITIKKLNEERGQPPLKTLEKFKSLVLSNSSPIPGDDIFGPRESKLIIDFAMEGPKELGTQYRVFQHHKLYQYVASNDQESCLDFIGVEIQEPLVLPPPLSEAVTLEAHEAELARLNELKEQERLAKEEWEAEERAAAANPFEVLSPESVKQIAADTVTAMLETICGELDGLLNEQSDRLMAQANKLTNLFAQ